MGFGKSFKKVVSKVVGKNALNVADNIFGPKSWKTGATIAGGLVGARALGGTFGRGPGVVGAQEAGGSSGGIAGMFRGAMPAILGNVVSGGLGYLGAKEQRESDLSSAREQMDFQNMMSSTAHQREVVDLKAAGLNPVLSANSGAPSAAGAMIDSENMMAGPAQAVQNAMSTALEMRRLKKDIEEADSRIAYNKSSAYHQESSAIEAQQRARSIAEEVGDMMRENDFNAHNPRYFGLKKYLSLIGDVMGTAKEGAFMGRAIYGFPGDPKVKLEAPSRRDIEHVDSYRRK